jgi:hypothetical protein
MALLRNLLVELGSIALRWYYSNSKSFCSKSYSNESGKSGLLEESISYNMATLPIG